MYIIIWWMAAHSISSLLCFCCSYCARWAVQWFSGLITIKMWINNIIFYPVKDSIYSFVKLSVHTPIIFLSYQNMFCFICCIRRKKKNQLSDSAKTPKLAAQLFLKYFHVLYFLQHEFCIFPRFHFHTQRTTTVYVCSFENRFRDALFYVRFVKSIK